MKHVDVGGILEGATGIAGKKVSDVAEWTVPQETGATEAAGADAGADVLMGNADDAPTPVMKIEADLEGESTAQKRMEVEE